MLVYYQGLLVFVCLIDYSYYQKGWYDPNYVCLGVFESYSKASYRFVTLVFLYL